MATRRQEEFHEFATKHNEIAPVAIFARALGIDETATQQAHDQRIADIESAVVDGVVESGMDRHIGMPEQGVPTIIEIITSKIDVALPRGKDRLSMIDALTLGLTEWWQIKKFLRLHDLDMDDNNDLETVVNILSEATEYFNDVVAEGRNPRNKIEEAIDLRTITKEGRVTEKKRDQQREMIYKIFRSAAGQEMMVHVQKACALLRIAFAIDRLNTAPRATDLIKKAETKLYEKLNDHFYYRDGNWYFSTKRTGDIPMPLSRLEKRTKDRKSSITKLLIKPSTNPKEMVDNLGVRVETKNPSDTLRFIYNAFYRPETAIFPGFKADPAETQQLALNQDAFLEALADHEKAKKLLDAIHSQAEGEEEQNEGITKFVSISNGNGSNVNPHSQHAYKGIIHINIEICVRGESGNRVYVPVEFQIVDRESRLNIDINAPHATYKETQKARVRERVAGNNLMTEFKKC